MRGEDAQGCAGTARMAGGKAIVDSEDVAAADGERDGGTLAGTKTPGRHHGSEELKLCQRCYTGFRDGACTDSCGKALLLVGIPVCDFYRYVISDDECVREPGEQVRPVDAQKIDEH